MRALWVVLLCAACAPAWGEEPDPLFAGRDLLEGAERERGVALLRTVIAEAAAAPKDAGKQQRAGRAHMYLEEEAEAVAAMERAHALEPENARFAFWLGAARLPIDVDRSIEAFEKAVRLDPKDADGWFGLGRAKDKKGDLAAALAAFLKAVELDPDYTDARARAAGVLRRLDRNDEAIAAYREVLKREPDRVSAGYHLGSLEYQAGRFEQARDAWLGVEPHAPRDLQLKARIVQAYFALGRYAEAEPWREKVRKLHADAQDEETRSLKDYCFDEFAVDDLRVTALELFDRSEEALYRYIFRVTRDGKFLRRINLEPGPVAPALGITGGSFLLGANDDAGHVTFDKRWKSEPPYPELKAAVIDAIRGKLDAVSSSRKGRKDAGGGGK